MSETGKYRTTYLPVTIKTLDGTIMQGKTNINIRERLSDLFTKEDTPFIILVDATDQEGRYRTLFVNKRNIVWVQPED